MKWCMAVLAVLLLTMLGWMPFEGTDVATLEPAEMVYVYINKEEVCLQTDGGWSGSGKSVAEAVTDLHASTPGRVFLQTVDFLLVDKDSQKVLPQLFSYLRSGCGLALIDGRPELKNALAYLRTHRPGLTLQMYRAGAKNIPELILRGEEGYLIE